MHAVQMKKCKKERISRKKTQVERDVKLEDEENPIQNELQKVEESEEKEVVVVSKWQNKVDKLNRYFTTASTNNLSVSV